jgi:hypothetical protein
MRNSLYPGRQARYVVGLELKELLKSGAKIERDNQYLLQKAAEIDLHAIQREESQQSPPQEGGEAIKLASITVRFIPSTRYLFKMLIIHSLNALPDCFELCYLQIWLYIARSTSPPPYNPKLSYHHQLLPYLAP